MNIQTQKAEPSIVLDESGDARSPIRSTFQNADELAALGRQLSMSRKAELFGFRELQYPERLKDNENAVLKNYRAIAEASRRRQMITPAAEWLLDHHHTVKENFRQVQRDLPVRFFRQLPDMEIASNGRLPRMFALAWNYVAHTDSTFTPTLLTAIVEGFQEVETLTIGEIWALPATLRYVLLENLRRLSDRVDVSRRMRDEANRFADYLTAHHEEAELERAFRAHEQYTADDSFAAQLLYRLREDSEATSAALTWLEEMLEARDCDAEETIVLEHGKISTGNLTVGNIIRSLKRIDDFGWTAWFEEISKVDRVLRDASDFADLDARTRNYYRTAIERIARRSVRSEMEIALLSLEMSDSQTADVRRNNVGYYLVGKGVEELERAASYRKTLGDRLYSGIRGAGLFSLLVPAFALAAAIMILVGYYLNSIPLSDTEMTLLLLVVALPTFDAAMAIWRSIIFATVPPSFLPGYAFKSGVPDSARTLVVIPCLISDRDSISTLVRNLEVHYLANSDQQIFFALLSDWADSSTEEMPADRDLLAFAQSEIDALAERYAEVGPRRFFLLHRRRLWNPSEGLWMGWERKRGKLLELNQLIRGEHDTTFLPVAAPLPQNIRYVLTLDSDTRLPRDSARVLIGKMAHPLNAPVLDPQSKRVIDGYGILQPRIMPSLTTGDEASVFQRVFSRDRGLDPYVFTVSDVYQDLCDEGSFTGKGLYHVEAFQTALEGRIGENSVLSHDLLEGAYARSGLVTDVAFIEDFPVRYDVEASRQHRWMRGDWQLLPYIFGTNSGVAALSRFKMLDNLRRSLTPPAWIVASLLGWCLLAPSDAALWQLILIAAFFAGPIISLFSGFVPHQVGVAPESQIRTVLNDIVELMAQIALSIAFMAHAAGQTADAIGRTLYRLFISREKLLEWRTALEVDAAGAGGIGHYYALMWISPVIAVASAILVVAVNPANIAIVLFFSLVWLIAPALAWLVSQTLENEDRLDLSDADAAALRAVGRRTWHYFETFVTEEHNFLPPDNFQEQPEPIVAGRTSPTNIGLYLLSTITARDMGWISFSGCLGRIEQTISTVEKMEKFRGHLYNWYDTRDLHVMHPHYVSAVDSGNLAGHLIVVSSTLKEWCAAVAAHLMGDISGIGDTARVFRETLATIPDDRRSIRPLRRRLEERLDSFERTLGTLDEAPFAPVRTLGLSIAAREIHGFSRDLDMEIASPETRLLVGWAERLHETCEAHFADAAFDRSDQQGMRERLDELGERARALAFGMDFSFLLNKERRLLSIGYSGEDGKLDEACYDLLASEARLASLFAIAKGDIASEHWFRLGRPVTTVAGKATLLSWSGSMFEYLMPPVVMHERQGGILNQSDNLAIAQQISYGKSLGVPWGVSESAYHAYDRELNYQYHNFGVPGLGLKRDLGNNVVIAPYATLLASQFKPHDAAVNLKKLNTIGALGVYGYYDAVDFTESRLPEGKTLAVVHNYMAHHQGMSITAIGNAVLNGRLRDRFHSDPVIEAAELLLQEKAPREAVPVRLPDTGKSISDASDLSAGQRYRLIEDPLHTRRFVSVLSNGHYAMMVSTSGAGYSMWKGLAVTRWRADPTVDMGGTYIFLRDIASGDWWSASPGPKPFEREKTNAIFSDEKAEFNKTVGTIRSRLECVVTTEADAEGRRLTVVNTGTSDRLIEITSYGELVLGSPDADAAHPAFSKMFVKTEIADAGDLIYAHRNKRNHDEPDIEVAHLIVAPPGRSPVQAETDRRAFIGCGRDLGTARAFDKGFRLEGKQGFTLDPIFALRKTIRIPAGKDVSVVFWTVAGPDRATLDTHVARYRHAENFDHEARLAWTRSQVQIRHLDTNHAEAMLFQRIASFLIYPDTRLKQAQAPGRSATAPQSALWPLAISGDFPIFALRIDDEADLAIIQKSFRMQEYLRSRGVISDLVIINERAASYAQSLQHGIDFMCENARKRGLSSGPAQHVFSVRRDLIEPDIYQALLSAARLVLHTRNGPISAQIARLERMTGEDATPPAVAGPKNGNRPKAPRRPGQDRKAAADGADLLFWNGYGGFDPESRDYIVRLRGGDATPQPWINVIANDKFGFHISSEGAAFTWSSNSRDYQLTPWSNDPVVNRLGEAFYIRDLHAGRTLSPYAAINRDPAVTHDVRHGPGYSIFRAESDGLTVEIAHIVAAAEPARLMRFRITNTGDSERRLRLYAYAEWVLGNNRARTAAYIRNWHMQSVNALLAQNPFSIENGKRTAFLASDRPLQSYTASRSEFLGMSADTFVPSVVEAGTALSNSLESSGDPCAAMAIDLTIPSGETSETLFILGDVETPEQAAPLIERLTSAGFDTEMQKTVSSWENFLDTLQVSTPDPAFDRLVNTWLPYQSLACRIRARSAFYQASGAFGFRDQLQDTLALMLHEPGLARAQIINAASRQFLEGDVQHWWLPKNGAGVRTLISDDVVWLAYATASYVSVTGDQALLDEQIGFLRGPPLEENHESFFTPERSEETASLYDHCVRALDLAIRRTGEHDLPLILGGDWNDGMNRVGIEGRGESTWLGWFLILTLDMMIPIAKARGDARHASSWAKHRAKLKNSLEANAWDGEWYRRGYFDDGTPLGSRENGECRIDSIAQSWSVISAAGDETRSRQAMDSVWSHLVDDEARIIRLFTPPFEQSEKDPGYIKSYPPGVRENGGQYTHAAIWVAYALARMGRADDAYRAFSFLNPINHALTKEDADLYRVEPYVVAADIYGAADRTGRGGWTWYTGSAGWLYRTATEAILGIRREGNAMRIEPALPSNWQGYEAALTIDGRRFEIKVERSGAEGLQVLVNSKRLTEGTFKLHDA